MRLSLVTHRGVINVITKTKLFFLGFEVLRLQLQFATPSNDLLKYNKYGNQENKKAMLKFYPIPLGYTFILCNVYLFLPRLTSCDNPTFHVTNFKRPSKSSKIS